MVLIVPNTNANVHGGKARPGVQFGGVVAACVGAAGLVACRPDKYVNDLRRASRSRDQTNRYEYILLYNIASNTIAHCADSPLRSMLPSSSPTRHSSHCRLFTLQLSDLVIDCISGGLGEAAALVSLFPLDTLKVHCQARSISIRVALSHIFLQGPVAGIKSLYAGVGTAAIGAAVVGAVHLSVYRYWSRLEQRLESSKGSAKATGATCSPLFAVFGATMSSLTVGALEAPLDQIKLRTQAKTISGPPLAHLMEMLSSQGARQIFNSSFVPFVLKAIPHDVGEFVTFGMLSDARHVEKALQPLHNNAKDALIGAIAGCVAAVLSTPFEVVCTKVQTSASSPSKVHHTLTSSLKGFTRVAKKEFARGGIRALYVGFIPRLLHMVPASVIYWLVVEESRRNLVALSS